MTREEALQAMIDGHKVTHRFFTSDEFIYMKAQDIYTEEGYNMGTVNSEFWRMRGDEPGGELWHDGWSLYKEK